MEADAVATISMGTIVLSSVITCAMLVVVAITALPNINEWVSRVASSVVTQSRQEQTSEWQRLVQLLREGQEEIQNLRIRLQALEAAESSGGGGGDDQYVTLTGDQTIAGTKTFTSAPAIDTLTPYGIVVADEFKELVSMTPLDDGELLIGSSGAAPVVASMTGTANQVIVTSGPGSITLSTPQDLDDAASPSFASLALTDSMNQLVLTAGASTVTLTTAAQAGNRVYTIPDIGASTGIFLMSGGSHDEGGDWRFYGQVTVNNGIYYQSEFAALPIHVTVDTAGPAGDRTYTIPTLGASTSPIVAEFIMSEGAQTMNAIKTFSSAPRLTSLSAYSVLMLDATQNMIGQVLLDGQVLIGDTGGQPIAATLSGTTNRITVTNGPGTITLNLPQDIDLAATPEFAGIILSDTSNQLVLGGAGASITVNAAVTLADRVYTLPDVGTATASFVMTELAQLINGLKTFGAAPILDSLSAAGVLSLSATKQVVSTQLANGQFLVGRGVGTTPIAATLTGTTNQIIITNGVGSITISLPQDIDPSSSPIFQSLTLEDVVNQLVLGSGAAVIIITAAPPAATVTYSIPDAGVDSSFLLADGDQLVNGLTTFTQSPRVSSLTANTMLTLGALKELVSTPLTNGQLMIGSTDVAPVAATLTGTADQIVVTNGAGSIVLSLSQSIAPSSTPTFTSLTLAALSNQLTLGGGANSLTINSITPSLQDLTYTIPDTLVDSAFVMTELAQTINGSKTFGAAPTFSSLTPSGILTVNASRLLVSTAMTNGQVMIGRDSNTPIAATLSGATDQISITNGSGTITIGFVTTPIVASMRLSATSDQLVLGTGTARTTLSAPATGVNRTYTLPDVGGAASFIMSAGNQTMGGIKSFADAPVFSSLANHGVLFLSATSAVTAVALTSGQILIGGTSSPAAATLTGTTNQITVTNGVNSITLSLPQSIATSSTPSFASMTLSATTDQLVLGAPAANITIRSLAPAASRIYSIPDAGTTSSFIMANGAQTLVNVITFTAAPVFSSTTARQVLFVGATKSLSGVVLTTGQFVMGVTSSDPVAASLLGTTDQIVVTVGANSITLSTPQSIATTSSPTFASLTLTTSLLATATSNQIVLGTGTARTTLTAPATGVNRTYTIPDTAGTTSSFIMANGAQTFVNVMTFTAAPIFSSPAIRSVLYLSDTGSLTGAALTNGQLLIGSDGAVPVAATLTGATDQVSITNGAGSITVGLVATPVVTSMILTQTSNQLVLGAVAGPRVTISAPTPAASRFYTIPVLTSNANFVMTEGTQLINGLKSLVLALAIQPTTNQLILGTTRTVTINAIQPASASLTYSIPDAGTTSSFIMANSAQTFVDIMTFTAAPVFSSTTARQVLFVGATKSLSGVVLTTGQFVMGATGADPVAASLLGTTDQIVATVGANSITLSTPQSIATTSSPTFASLTLTTALLATATTNQLVLGTGATTTTISAAAPAAARVHSIPILTANASFVMTEGIQTVNGAKTMGSALAISPTTNQLVLGAGATTTISAPAPAASRVYTVPDAGAAASFVMTASDQTLAGVKTFSSAPIFSSLSVHRILIAGGAGAITGTALTNGQLLIGSTGAAPVTAGLNGTANQVSVATGAGSITLGLPQDIHTGATPTFSTLQCSSEFNQLILSNSGLNVRAIINCTRPSATRTYTIPDPGFTCNFVMSAGDSTIASTKTFSGSIIMSALTANTMLTLGATKQLVSTTLTNGQLMIGSTGAPVAGAITGTTDQVNVALGAGTIGLSLPQSIATTSTPIFESATLSTSLTIPGLTNQLIMSGPTRTATISVLEPATASRTYTVQDAGANANFIMSESDQTVNGLKTYGTGIRLPTTGGTATTLNYYEEYTHTSNWGGAYGTPIVGVNVQFVRCGRMVTVHFPQILGTITNTAQMWMLTNAPSRFRPAADTYIVAGVLQTSAGVTNLSGVIYLSAGGNFQIQNGYTGDFNSAGSPTGGLIAACSVSYIVP